ncbi:MAG TPA: bifunctional phosphopantothenoylcysteine decarboxylase/phosphopantothenate--cysteine ligase CoaBC [Chitinispirillaceae bacterium]|nr:bifunctional phosphopantothenoylcysteine decarboxylase/phosphopantothenate--cysteine ligase CoaBC [Chitinispirillaceae bacterium]
MSNVKRIVIGITGGIAAYKIPLLIRLLKKKDFEVKVMLTPAAKEFVGIEALRTVSGNPVYLDDVVNYDMDHIRLAEWGDLFLIAPATANTIAKIAHGIADNLVTTSALSFPEHKLMIVPAMNTIMWQSKATQENCRLCSSRGIRVLPVDSGELACNVSGEGRMIPVEQIADAVATAVLSTGILKGKTVLISSGPTEENIDPVRVITNRSSGKMGAALVQEALLCGANVIVVSGPSSVQISGKATVINVRTASEMKAALESQFDNCDICIMAAAVSDYRPVAVSETKIPRFDKQNLTIELVPNPDILAGLCAKKTKQFVCGFSLESGDGEVRAREKMERKGCDMMVFNRADQALGSDTTRVVLLGKNGFREELALQSKEETACGILQRISEFTGS